MLRRLLLLARESHSTREQPRPRRDKYEIGGCDRKGEGASHSSFEGEYKEREKEDGMQKGVDKEEEKKAEKGEGQENEEREGGREEARERGKGGGKERRKRGGRRNFEDEGKVETRKRHCGCADGDSGVAVAPTSAASGLVDASGGSSSRVSTVAAKSTPSGAPFMLRSSSDSYQGRGDSEKDERDER